MSTTSSFAGQLEAFRQATGLKMSTIIRKLAFDGFAGVVRKSPVDTGRFRANWRVAIGNPDLTTDLTGSVWAIPTGQPPTGGEQAKAMSALSKVRDGSVVYITNNLPYAEPLENGHSKQAPLGMLRITVQELIGAFETMVKAVKAAANGSTPGPT